MTGGTYLQHGTEEALLESLLSVFLLDQHPRQLLVLPATKGLHFPAACFCHRKSVSTGFVCSVCLSSTCDEIFRTNRSRSLLQTFVAVFYLWNGVFTDYGRFPIHVTGYRL